MSVGRRNVLPGRRQPHRARANATAFASPFADVGSRTIAEGGTTRRAGVPGPIFKLVDVLIQMERERVTEIRFLPDACEEGAS